MLINLGYFVFPKEKAYQKKLQELAPRRASTRIAIKMSLREEDEREDEEERVKEREKLAEEKRIEQEEKQKEKERLAERRQQGISSYSFPKEMKCVDMMTMNLENPGTIVSKKCVLELISKFCYKSHVVHKKWETKVGKIQGFFICCSIKGHFEHLNYFS